MTLWVFRRIVSSLGTEPYPEPLVSMLLIEKHLHSLQLKKNKTTHDIRWIISKMRRVPSHRQSTNETGDPVSLYVAAAASRAQGKT